ncbi:MAG: glucokinase [Deltaproteobacteria bacterium]|nr:glucokinase [Deltaproteobacteria bacterium]
MPTSNILAGDIGGTKTILALVEAGNDEIAFNHLARYESGAYSSLEEIIEEFLAFLSLDRSKTVASFGIAGAVKDGRCRTTNLPWTVDEKSVASALSLRKVGLVNDFTAIIWGIPFLNDSDKLILNEGKKEKNGPIAVLGAGTGLGEGAAFYSQAGGGYEVISSEGGHATFSPTSDEEIGLLKYLMGKLGHVSFERLLSGQGLVNIFNYLKETSAHGANDSIITEMKNNDPAAVIAKHAVEGNDLLAEKALHIFLSLYGSEAGNVALKFLPYGGLYIAGGIAAKIAVRFKERTFLEAFLNKGRMADLLRRIPVGVVLREEVGLMGAAVRGREMMKKL